MLGLSSAAQTGSSAFITNAWGKPHCTASPYVSPPKSVQERCSSPIFRLLRIEDIVQRTAKVAILFNQIELKRIGRKAVPYETNKTEAQAG